MNGDDGIRLASPSWMEDGLGIQGEVYAPPQEFRRRWATNIGIYEVKDSGVTDGCCCTPQNLDWFNTITVTATGNCTGSGPCSSSDFETATFTRAEVDLTLCPDPLNDCYPPEPGTFWLYKLCPECVFLIPPDSDIRDSFMTSNIGSVVPGEAWGRVRLEVYNCGLTEPKFILTDVEGQLTFNTCCGWANVGGLIPGGFELFTTAGLFGTHTYDGVFPAFSNLQVTFTIAF